MAGGKKNVLIIGSGGREHALAWKLSQSPQVNKVYCAPGNPGMDKVAERVDLAVHELKDLLKFAKEKNIDLTIPGSEESLCAGVVDMFHDNDLTIFGPSKAAAQLEGSKVFSKLLMRRHGIPTADFRVFDKPESAYEFAKTKDEPMVVKADGLAAGKGAIVCKNAEAAFQAIDMMLVERKFGDACNRIVIEDFIKGEEVSYLVLIDGDVIVPLASSQDHKAVNDDDEGPNTGGMGAYSPAPALTPHVEDQVIKEIIVPTVHAMRKEGCSYSGVLYVGLMIANNNARVLEFNCRFGDPETQPLLARFKGDLFALLHACATGKLDRVQFEWDPRASVCVVMTAGGYPGKYQKGMEVTGIADAETDPDVVVFQAGTSKLGRKLVTAGGRVLGVTALGDNLSLARDKAYEAVSKIKFENCHFRKDIAAKGIAHRNK